MQSEEERTPDDVLFALSSGERFASMLLSERIEAEDWRRDGILPRAETLTHALLEYASGYAQRHAVVGHHPNEIASSIAPLFVLDIDNALRVLSLCRFAHAPVPVIRAGGGLEGFTLFDLFSPRAIEGTLGITVPDDRSEYLQRSVIRRLRLRALFNLLRRSGSVSFVAPRQATRGVMRLFADSLRTALRWPAAPSALNPFRVESGSGYQLDSYPQHRYTPVVFGGGAVSSPVDGHLATGHYCFQGWRRGRVKRDGGSHFAGPSSNFTKLRGF
jgi:hypothetical protein